MTAFDPETMSSATGPQQVRFWAEARARAAITDAEARAEALTATAIEHAKELIAKRCGNLQELAESTLSAACVWPGFNGGHVVSESSEGSLLVPVDHDELRRAISVRAYFKAVQRGFWPGHDTEDWLEAEQEILTVSSFFKTG
jgi:hypothetical protein